VAFALRAGWGLTQPAGDEAINALPDQREYLALARNLLSGRGLQFYDERFKDTVLAYRTPGYPAFIAAVGARVRAVRLAQAVVDTSTVLAIFWLARALLKIDRPSRAALLAAGLVAANPFLIYFSGLLLSETLFTAMLAWGMLLLVVGGRGARLRLPVDEDNDAVEPEEGLPPRRGLGTLLWLAGGLLLALSGLVRPSAVPLAVLMGIAAAFVNRPQAIAYETGRGGAAGDAAHRAYGPRWPLPVGSTMLLLTAAVLLPWAVRNARVLKGEWVWTTTNEGITLYDGLNPDATGASNQAAFVKAMPHLAAMGEVGRSQYLSARAKAFAREHPARAAQLAVIKAGRTWSPVPLSDQFGSRRNRVIALLYTVPLDVLVLCGLLGRGLGRSAKVFLLLPAIYFTGVHMLSVGSLRYRIPVEPPITVIAAAAFVRTPLPWKRATGDVMSET
jgi:hypothetical protein